MVKVRLAFSLKRPVTPLDRSYCIAHKLMILYTRARACAARVRARAHDARFIGLFALLLMAPCSGVLAAGTLAGATIDNIATLTYSAGGAPLTMVSNTASFRVDEIINVRLTAPTGPTSVVSPEQNKALLFLLTNVGNGPESFNLASNLNPAVADQFNPLPGSAGSLFTDVNGNGIFDPGVDTPITGAVSLSPDQTLRVLLVSDIPSGRNNGDQAIVTLTAVSTTPNAAGAAVGTVLPGLGTPLGGGAPVDAVVGIGSGGRLDSGADDIASGIYLVSSVTIALTKSVITVTTAAGVTTNGCNAAVPPAACAVLVPGTRVTYRVTLTVSGSGTAQQVLFSDNIPANTTWVAGSIRVDGVVRSDVADGDNAQCVGCGNATGALAVNFGDVTVAPVTPESHTIDYQLTIN